MKLSLKLFLSTLLTAALAFGAAGFFLIQSVFSSALEQEVRLAQEENQLLALSFQAAAGERSPTDSEARRIAQALASTGLEQGHLLRLRSSQGLELYSSAGAPAAEGTTPSPSELVSQVTTDGNGRRFVLSVRTLEVSDGLFYLESFRDISNIFTQREAHYALYRLLLLVLLPIFALAVWLMTRHFTAPLRRLSVFSRRFASGEYTLRAPEGGGDEVGQLTRDFNTMAGQLEQKISDLEEAARRREEFIAAFAHELKTPLTAVIGYADMLRSRALDEEQQFRAASYIFSEGKRLESLSWKLLDLIVLGREELSLRPLSGEELLRQAAEAARPAFQAAEISFTTRADPGTVDAEPDLIRSLLLNLCDNARKATPAGGQVSLSFTREAGGFAFTVTDTGTGMPPEVVARITEPFYMADKSRSRAQNGAGLGLALCARIAQLHGGQLTFDSAPGRGTAARLFLPERRREA